MGVRVFVGVEQPNAGHGQEGHDEQHEDDDAGRFPTIVAVVEILLSGTVARCKRANFAGVWNSHGDWDKKREWHIR